MPLDANNCVLYGYVRSAKGLPVQGVSVLISSPATWPEPGFIIDTGVPVGEGEVDEDVEALSDVNGFWFVELRRERLVRVRIVRLKIDVTQRVPDTNNQDFYFWGFQPRIVDSRQFVLDPVNSPTVVDTTVVVKIDSLVLPQIMDLYEQIKIWRCATRNGVYVEVTAAAAPPVPTTRLELSDEAIFYEFAEAGTDPGLWYKASLFNATRSKDGPLSPPFRADAPDYAGVAIVDELKEHYLFGVDLTDDVGRPYPKSLYEGYLRSAIGWMERNLVVSLKPAAQVERQDFQIQDYIHYGYVQTDWVPLLVVDSVEFMLGDQVLFTIPPAWLQTDLVNGVIRLVPAQGALASVFLSSAGAYVGPGIIMYNDTFPGFLRVTYRHGFGLGQVPAEVKDCILKRAALGPLNIAGDLLIGAGIASLSTSAGGVSQSVGSTSSATNSGYGARILQYMKEIKEVLPGLIRHWRGIRATVV